MATPIPTALPEPLRLPRGSVRGGIAILASATYAYLLLQKGTVPTVLVNAVVVVIAFYFGTHPLAAPPAVRPGQPAPRRPRLVRVLLLFGFLGLAAWFLRGKPSFAGIPPDLLSILEVLGGYVLGATLSWLAHRRALETPFRKRLATIFRDVSAAGALGLTAYICFALATGQVGAFAGRAEEALSLVVTYYFGSRVIGH